MDKERTNDEMRFKKRTIQWPLLNVYQEIFLERRVRLVVGPFFRVYDSVRGERQVFRVGGNTSPSVVTDESTDRSS